MYDKNAVYLIAAAFLLISSSACNQSTETEQDTTSDGFSVPIPASLLSYTLNELQLKAQLIIDDREPIDLTVEIDGRVASTEVIKNLDDASHVTLSFFVIADKQKIEIASSTIEAPFYQGESGQAEFKYFKYTDNDQDGFTNLAEIVKGYNWNDWSEKPVSLTSRSSFNYEISDPVDESYVERNIELTGVSYSSNYSNRSRFN